MWKRKILLNIHNKSKDFQQVFVENRIDFTIQSYLGWSADECKIEIYNLSPEMVTNLYLLDDKEFILNVGYADESMQTIFTGRIINVWGRKELPNHITTLWCVPNSAIQIAQKLPTINYSGKTIEEIINDLAERANYPKYSTKFIGFDDEAKFPRKGYLLRNYDTSGTLVEELDRICTAMNARFQCTDSNIKIISNTISNQTVELMKKDGVAVHKIDIRKVKGTPEISVASTDITVNLDANINAGDVLDYTELGESAISMQSTYGINSTGGVLFRDPNIFKYIIYNQYQILTVTHVGSNFAPVWETKINGTVFNEYVTAGDESSHDATGITGFSPKVAGITYNSDGSLTAFLPGQGASSGVGAQAQAAANVEITDEQKQILFEVTGQDEEKRRILENILRIENRGFGKVNNNAVSPVGAVGAFQFMPETARNLGVKDRTDFRQSAEGAGKYVDEVRGRLGKNFSLAAMYADYNAGPRASGPVSQGDYGSLVPETRDYLAMANELEGGNN